MTLISESNWNSYYGFECSPFHRVEADDEYFLHPGFTISAFVEPSCFDRILGRIDSPNNTIIYAADGGGKTTCRIMADYYYRQQKLPGSDNSLVLSVPHVHIERVIGTSQLSTQASEFAEVSVEQHLQEILGRMMVRFAELVVEKPVLQERLSKLTSSEQKDLSVLLTSHSEYVPGVLREKMLDTWKVDAKFLDENPVQTLNTTRSFSNPFPLNLNDSLAHLDHFVYLANQLGINRIFILVDNINFVEIPKTNVYLAYKTIQPLIAYLPILTRSFHLAFKLFLSYELESLIKSDTQIKLEEINIEHLGWSPEELLTILRQRLQTYKLDINQDRTTMGFDALCAPDLRGNIEKQLVNLANGNPRTLLLLCNWMIQNHCSREPDGPYDPYYLSRKDWLYAQSILQKPKEYLSINKGEFADNIPFLQELIAQGEGSKLEFKSGLRWDYNTNSINQSLSIVIAKAIVGLMNAEGGILLIGIKDDGTIIGIEKDFTGLKSNNVDGFYLALINTIKVNVGVENTPNIKVSFIEVEKKIVCIVRVTKAPEPVFIKNGETHEFWVRTGNSTRLLDVKAAIKYTKYHWK
jgi:hypothetical protein